MEETKEIKEIIKNAEEGSKEFHKTPFGKFVGITTIVACFCLILWVFIAGTEAIFFVKELDNEKYQTLFDFGNTLLDFSFYCSVVCSCAYSLFTRGKDEIVEEGSVKDVLSKKRYFKGLMIFFISLWYVILAGKIGYVIGTYMAR